MQIHRVFFSSMRTISSKILPFHRIHFVRSFFTQKNPESNHQQPLNTSVLPVYLRMETADKKAQELSKYIRATHGKLRNEYRKIKDPDAAWSVHIENKEALQHYAAAMHKLAEHWEAKVENKDYVSRLNWCYQAMHAYFRKGELEKTRDKELRKVSFHLPHLLGPLNRTSCETMSELIGVDSTAPAASKVSEAQGLTVIGITDIVSNTAVSPKVLSTPEAATTANDGTEANSRSVAADSTSCDIGGDQVASQSLDCAATAEKIPSKDWRAADSRINERKPIVYGDRLKVLDVGSCYNPFSRYPDLDVTALDLQPATEDVYRCDFLKLNICDSSGSSPGASPIRPAEQRNEVGSADAGTAATTQRVITTLPANSFDAVVFSFFLSYIPSPELRLRCCKNAYRLLKPEGALVIAAADSRGQLGNGYVFKCWQITMASLGLVRVKYEKLKDFHGMIFRKRMYPEVCQIDANRLLEELKVKKLEMETDYETLKKNKIKFSRRRIRHIESFDLDKALVGLWLPNDLNESNQEEYVVTAAIDSAKRKRNESEQEPDVDEPSSKTSKGVCPSGQLDQGAEESCPDLVVHADETPTLNK